MIDGGSGADILIGGTGIDTLVYSESSLGVTVNLETGAASGGDAAGDTLTLFENIVGSDHHDSLTGDAKSNRIEGGLGNDVLNGGAGDDLFIGGDGADTMVGGSGFDTVAYGSSIEGVYVYLSTGSANGGDAEGDSLSGIEGVRGSSAGDVLIGDSADNVIEGGGGNDTIAGGIGADTLNGGAGLDTVSYVGSDVGISINLATGVGVGGDAEGDILSGFESLIASVYSDTIIGDAGDTYIHGNNGDDVIEGAGGADHLTGGEGTDTLSYAKSSSGVAVDLVAGTATGGDAEGDIVLEFENLLGSDQSDALMGDSGSNMIDGGLGEDLMTGRAGDDTYVIDRPGDRVIENEGDGVDTIRTSISLALVAHVENLVLTGDDDVTGAGNAASNLVTGNDGSNKLDGRVGADQLNGGFGDDVLIDRDGGDTLAGGIDNDVYRVFASDTTIIEAATAGIDTVLSTVSVALSNNVENLTLLGPNPADGTGNSLDNVIRGNGTGNVLDGLDGEDTLLGLAGNDFLNGGGGNDRLRGGGGFDTLDGGGGADDLFGDAGGDVLSGGDGADRLFGGDGNDALTGGAGADMFIFQDAFGGDTIADFEDGVDRIDLRDIREENGSAPLSFDQLLISNIGGGGARIFIDLDRNDVADTIDLNGDGTTDVARITLLAFNANDLSSSDFLL